MLRKNEAPSVHVFLFSRSGRALAFKEKTWGSWNRSTTKLVHTAYGRGGESIKKQWTDCRRTRPAHISSKRSFAPAPSAQRPSRRSPLIGTNMQLRLISPLQITPTPTSENRNHDRLPRHTHTHPRTSWLLGIHSHSRTVLFPLSN
jgi:hypothetical protein